MKEDFKDVNDKELMQIYRLLLEQKEFLENAKEKMKEEDKDEE